MVPGGSLLPGPVVRSAVAMGLPLDSISPLPGLTGRTWASGDHILRIGAPAGLHLELLGMAAASTVVPVPEVVDLAELSGPDEEGLAAYLMTRLPGRPAADTRGLSEAAAHRVGARCGRLHSALASVEPPTELPDVGFHAAASTDDPAPQVGLLHLDLHPLNVLVDDQGEVSGVVDWANVARGPGVLDRARTWSILTLDPAALRLSDEPQFASLVSGWSTTACWSELPALARAWACEYLLQDLAPRHPSHLLEPARRQLAINQQGH